MSGSASTRNVMSPSQSAAAILYSSDALISTMNAWNHSSVGNVGTRCSWLLLLGCFSLAASPRGRRAQDTGSLPAREDDQDPDHIEGDVGRDVRDEVPAAFV